jgi:hypothetical protein
MAHAETDSIPPPAPLEAFGCPVGGCMPQAVVALASMHVDRTASPHMVFEGQCHADVDMEAMRNHPSLYDFHTYKPDEARWVPFEYATAGPEGHVAIALEMHATLGYFNAGAAATWADLHAAARLGAADFRARAHVPCCASPDLDLCKLEALLHAYLGAPVLEWSARSRATHAIRAVLHVTRDVDAADVHFASDTELYVSPIIVYNTLNRAVIVCDRTGELICVGRVFYHCVHHWDQTLPWDDV